LTITNGSVTLLNFFILDFKLVVVLIVLVGLMEELSSEYLCRQSDRKNDPAAVVSHSSAFGLIKLSCEMQQLALLREGIAVWGQVDEQPLT
jgi:hypothetical protein